MPQVVVTLFRYECANCDVVFSAPVFLGAGYGELSARSAGLGTLAYVNALQDPEFDEVAEIAGAVIKEARLPVGERNRGESIQFAYQVACDPDVDGIAFVIGGHPRCPACGLSTPASWAETDEQLAMDLPVLTHRAWAEASPDQRRSWVSEKVLDFLSG